MSLKRRLQNLESQPAKHVDGDPVSTPETALQFALRYREELRKEQQADPEGFDRRRRELLRADGWPPGYNPSSSEIMQRILERNN